MLPKQEIVQLLKGIYTICRTSEAGYRAAADAIDIRTTRELFKSYADQRQEFSQELQGEIRFHSGKNFISDPPKDSWKQIHHAVQMEDPEAIIRACEEAEEAMLRVYKEAISKEIPWDVETVLAHQYADIKKAYYLIGAVELFSYQFVA
jgi:uncharacterized protein (TIGR02284 family)